MSDRIKGVIVTFDEDLHGDEAEAVIAAIKQLRHVAAVTPSIMNVDDIMNRRRVLIELRMKLWDALG